MDDDTRQQRLREKNRHNLVTAVAFLLSNWFLSFTVTLAGLVALLFFPRYGMVSIFSSAAFAFFFAILWLWLVERAGLGFGRLTPKVVPVLDGYYWYHERHWKLCGLGPWFAGTPFKNVISRLQGIRLGKKVFDDGASCTECSLIEIGDYTNVNVGCVIQPHSLEEGVFKSDYIKIGAGCTLGCASLVHYGVTMGDHVVLEPDSFLMKGEIVDPNTTWRGNPARAVGEPAVRGAAIERETPEIFVPAKAA